MARLLTVRQVKENAARLYQTINNHQTHNPNGQNLYGTTLQQTIHEFNEALNMSTANMEHLRRCIEVFNKIAEVEKSAPKGEPPRGDYASEEHHPPYGEDRSATTVQPEQKKIRRGVSFFKF